MFLENVSLHLVEDRQSNNITSPGPVPIDASISRLHISRNKTGLFIVEPPGRLKDIISNEVHQFSSQKTVYLFLYCSKIGRARKEESAELERLERSLKRVTSENDELRRRLAAFEQLSEENHRLRRAAEESNTLR